MSFEPPPVWLLPFVIAALVLARLLWRRQQRATALMLACLAMLGIALSAGYRATLAPTSYDALTAGFELEDVAGGSHTLSPAGSQHLLLWRSDCAPCRTRLTELAALPDDERRQWRLVNQGEALLTVLRYMDNTHPHRFADRQLLLDPRQRLWASLDEAPLPLTVTP